MNLRRRFLAWSAGALALGALGALGASGAVGSPPVGGKALRLGPPRPFSFDALIARARTLAAAAWVEPPLVAPDVLQKIDYDAHGRIRFDTDWALFRDGPGPFPVTFFHLGQFFPTPVHMHRLNAAGGETFSQRVVYDGAYFDMPADSPARRLPGGAGFAGFRFQESRLGDQRTLDWRRNDWVAFLGASYFRAIGEHYQYGLSARGVAIDAAVADRPEEFPDFTDFFFEPPEDGSTRVTVYALLQGPSVTGAFKFVMQREKAVIMEIEQTLFLRADVARLGLVPLTSMYWYGETRSARGLDWRPEVHDSDGLALWTGAGERIWRPLNNPPATRAAQFNDRSPKGFGLLQRDRDFDHYQDGVHYDKRPSLWVEPLGDWGEGSVQLIEIPTDDEIHDNILACWVPKAPAVRGSTFALKYRLHWAADEPTPTHLSRCVATRTGRGGQPGQARPPGVVKFMVEFMGGPLAQLAPGARPEAVLSASSGSFSYIFTEAVPNGVPGHWRAQFDFAPAAAEVADLRLYLKLGDQALSETWLYQVLPNA